MEVKHNTAANRFEIALPDGQFAVADYRQEGDKLFLTHTMVPEEFGGQGIAGKLAKAAYEHIRKEGLRAVPACSYMEVYAKRHPEYADLIEAS